MEIATTSPARPPIRGPLLFSLFLLAGASMISVYNYLIFHGLIETFSALVAFCVFVLAWHTRELARLDYLVFLGIGYLFCGLIDLLHSAVFPGMHTFDQIQGLNPSIQLWVAARALQAVSLVLAPLWITRRLSPNLAFGLFAAAAAIMLEGIFRSGWFPTAYVEGQGLTPFKVYAEYAIAAAMLLGAYGFHAQRAHLPPKVYRLLVTAILATAASELAFTAYLSYSDAANIIGHLLKLLAVYLVFRVVVAEGLRDPYSLLFAQLNESNQAIAKHRDQLKSLLNQQSRELELSDEEVQRRIEEQTRTQQALFRQRSLIEQVLDALPVNVFVKDSQGRFILVNGQVAQMLGRSKEEMIGLTDLDVFGPEQGVANQADDARVFDGQGPVDSERTLDFKEGRKVIWFVKRLLEIGENAEKMVLGFSIDITERKAMENQLREAKEMAEAANKAKSNFLGVMSHELRTPLNGILGITQLMLLEETEEAKREHLKIVLSSGNALMNILGDILDISRIEEHSLRPETKEFDPLVLLDNLAVLFRASAQAKGLAFEYHKPEEPVGLLKGDDQRINQILSNLLANAVKFTEQGQISLRLLLEKAEDDRLGLRFEVEDTGIGIPEDRQERIFEAFTQIDSSSTRQFSGTGLGLSIARRLTDLLGGTLGLTSEMDRGSLFWVRLSLPRVEPANRPKISATDAPHLHSVPQRSGKRRILIAEDDRVNQIVLEKMVESYGAEAVMTSNGAEALDRFSKESFDLVLMDWLMPVIDGMEATRRIRAMEASEGLVKTPVVAVTAKVTAQGDPTCRNAGVDQVLHKPIRFEDLKESLDQFIGQAP